MNHSPFGEHNSPASVQGVRRAEAAFDNEAFKAQIRTVIHSPKIVRASLQEFQQRLDSAYVEGADVGALIRQRAVMIDTLVQELWQSLGWKKGEGSYALIAVGGYGRGELHPFSDVDLLLLLKGAANEEEKEQISRLVTFLWDCGLELGHSVRTLGECVSAAKDDVTIMTNLLESRVLIGCENLHQSLMKKVSADHMWPPAQFFIAKWQEQRDRYQTMEAPDYNLEPNIKTSPGGLRDIQTIIWIAKRYLGEADIEALVSKGFLTPLEAQNFRDGLEFLWSVRYALHMVSNRHEDRLLFEFQLKIAKLLGYADDNANLAVEKFMESYYRCAMRLAVLNEVLIQHFDQSIVASDNQEEALQLNERFSVSKGYIDVRDEAVFEEHPWALLEIFVLMAENTYILGVKASTIRLIRKHRERIDDDFRQDPRTIELFLRLLRSGRNVPLQFKRMRQFGMLSAYLPAFGHIIGKMQFDLFHIYTVDVHTLEVMKNVYEFAYNSSQQDYILAAKIINGHMRIELLYLAALFHDIAKGRGGDHSELGALDCRDFCEKHNLDPLDTNLVVWLVENHLFMSTFSQKQDISDPDVIAEFCQQIGMRERLDYLFVLTVADIQGTNPELWTSWRASLLRQLYAAATRTFRRGLEKHVAKADVIKSKQANAMQLLMDKDVDIEKVKALWEDRNDEYFLRESTANIALLTRRILESEDDDQPLIVIQPSYEFGGEAPITQISIYYRLVENRFSFITLALEQLGLNIHDARLMVAGGGITLDTYYVLDLNEKPIPEGGDFERKILEKLKDVLTSADDRWFDSGKTVSRRLRSFSWPSETVFSNDSAPGFSVIEVIAPDRPGLLTVIAQVFFAHELRLHSAKISTLGERVEDVFFLTDREDQIISEPDKIEAIQRDLKTALDEHTQQ